MATLPTESEPGGCFSQCNSNHREKYPRKPRRKTGRSQHHHEIVNDAALAKEINSLSVEERNRIAKELCGVPDDDKEETPSFVDSCLDELEDCLAKLSHAKRKDLDRAVFLKPSIPNDKRFGLMFLRCENYNAKKAATRMASFFTLKRELFGEEKLGKKITLDDLNEQDIMASKTGGLAFRLSEADRAGRPIILVDISQSRLQSKQKLNRWAFHLMMSALESEAAQTKGIALIMFCPSDTFLSDRLPTPSEVLDFFKHFSIVRNSLPFRLTSGHFCYDNHMMKYIVSMFRGTIDVDDRLRLQTHFGSATELRYSLRSYGILTDDVILSQGKNDDKLKLWQQYLDSRRMAEQQWQKEVAAEESKTGFVAFPTPHSVLHGAGRAYQDFPGNQRFRELLDSQIGRYRECVHIFEKTIVLQEIMKTIHDLGGRFLKRVKNGWEISDEEAVKEKIRKYFRSKPGGVGGGSLVLSSGDPSDMSSASSKRPRINSSVDSGQGEAKRR